MRESPRDQTVLLLGGGHSHIEVLRRAIMDPLPGARLILVTDRVHSAYSGMVPALIAGEVDREALQVDIHPLARRAGATVIIGRVHGIDPVARVVHIDGRPPLSYDVCSVDVGGSVAGLSVPGVRENAVATRPLRVLLDRLEGLEEAPEHAAVVGAGAAGVELAFALRKRFPNARITLVDHGEHVLRRQGRWLRRVVRRALEEHRIILRLDASVSAVEPDGVRLADDSKIPSSLTLWATGAAPLPWLSDGSLPMGPRGFVVVDDDLRVQGFESLFAAGDCAVPASAPWLPRAGVYAVRMGPILANNLRALLLGRPLEPYRPQRSTLALLNVSDGTAIAAKAGIAWRSAGMWRWKNRIDRDWLDRYRGDGLPQMEPVEMECSGCAAKVPSDLLWSVLQEQVWGVTGEDAARIEPGLAWTVDAFPAYSHDAYEVARVAAGHALTDLWCKGVRPTYALAVLTIEDGPKDLVRAQLEQVQRGLYDVLDAHGIDLVGGHTVTGDALSVGLTALGPVEHFLGLQSAQEGDYLLVTKPLGTGVGLRADAMGLMSGAHAMALAESMRRVNATVPDVAHLLSAATDISGFGLANHLLDLLRASDLAAQVDQDALPVLPGVADVLRAGVRSTAAPANEASVQGELDLPAHPLRPLWFDPQTGGGMLLCCPPDAVEQVQDAVKASCIGRLVMHRGGVRVRVVSTSEA